MSNYAAAWVQGRKSGRAETLERAIEAVTAATSETFAGSTAWTAFSDALAEEFGVPIEVMRSRVYDAALKRTPIP